MKRVTTGLVLVLMVVLAGCGSAGGPIRGFEKGNQLAFYDFSEPNTFEEGIYGTIIGGVSLRIEDGVYRIRLSEGDSELWWGQWGDTYSDVVIDVDIEQLSERNENAYGVMCRVRGQVISPEERLEIDPEVQALATTAALSNVLAPATPEATEAAGEATAEATDSAETDVPAEATAEVTAEPVLTDEEATVPEGDGYLFLIQGAGSYAIMKSRGRDLFPLVNWTTSDAIHLGPDKNHMRAVCLGDYLALYVNDQFLADTIDNEYTEGQVGLAAGASNLLGVRVEFDNLTIAESKAK